MSVFTFRTEELRDLAVRHVWGTLVSGFHDGVDVRGSDWTVPGKPGQTVGDRQPHVRVLHVNLVVLGDDEADHHAICADLETIFDPLLDPGPVRVYGPYKGLASGHYRTIEARTVNYKTTERVPDLVTEYDITLQAIGDPPDWTEAS